MNLADAQQILADWIAADGAVRLGQNYSIDGLTLTRVDAQLITQKMNYWQRKVNELVDIENGHQPGVKTASFNH